MPSSALACGVGDPEEAATGAERRLGGRDACRVIEGIEYQAAPAGTVVPAGGAPYPGSALAGPGASVRRAALSARQQRRARQDAPLDQLQAVLVFTRREAALGATRLTASAHAESTRRSVASIDRVRVVEVPALLGEQEQPCRSAALTYRAACYPLRRGLLGPAFSAQLGGEGQLVVLKENPERAVVAQHTTCLGEDRERTVVVAGARWTGHARLRPSVR